MSIRRDDLSFDWDDHNIRHLARHGISPTEVEQVFRNDPMIEHYDVVDGEDRWTAIGAPLSLKILVLVFTVRDSRIRAVTGWEADKRMKKYYFANRGGG